MAEDIAHFTATIAAGTPKSAPAVVTIKMAPARVLSIDWRVPSGPMGVFGWQLAMGGVQVFPSVGDLFVVANDEHGTWTPSTAPDSGAWQVIGYNTGANPHSVYLAFHTDVPSRPAPFPLVLDPRQLSSSPDLSKAGPPVRRRP